MSRRILLLLFAILICACAWSQEKPVYEKTTFVSEEGRLYIQRDLGIYLWLSTSEEETSKKYRLKSEETTKYSNPMYLDVEGFNSVRSPSAVDPKTRKPVYPLRDIVFEVYSDGSAPRTSVDYGGSKAYSHEGKIYVMSNTEISILAKDALSGVKGIFYSLDNKPYTEYKQAITLSEEREYMLKYYAVDNVGNDGEVKETTYVYDNTPPVTTRTINKDEHENIISGRSTIKLAAEDKGIGVRKIVYSIDDGKEYTYQKPLRASVLSQGDHKLTYYAIDKVGNKEAVQTYNFYIDKAPPTIIEEVIGKSFFANGREFSSGKAQLKLTAFDNKAGVKEIRYSINNGEFKVYTKPVYLQSSGNLIIKTYAVDNVNNKSVGQAANEKTSIPYIDLSGPNLSHTISSPKFNTRDTTFIKSSTKIVLKAQDFESGVNRIEYSINGSTSQTYSEPFSIDQEGPHTITCTGYDNVENTSSTSIVVKVDNTGPTINHQFSTSHTGRSENGNTYPKYVILFLAGTDNVVGLSSIKYNINGSVLRNYTTPITNFAVGVKTMRLITTDKLGNKTEQEIKFEIKQ